MSQPVTTCPPETASDQPRASRKDHLMSTKPSAKMPPRGATNVDEATLAQVIAALDGKTLLSETRRRDLRSAVKRVAALLAEDPARIPLDLPAISARLGAINPVAAGLTPKTIANIRSDFLAAVKASGLKPVERSAKTPLSTAWSNLMARPSDKGTQIGLSRLARYASARGIEPEQIDAAAIERYIAAIREGSLHRKPNDLHRQVALAWKEVTKLPEFDLKPVPVPSFRGPAKRIDWTLLSAAFQKDVEDHLAWCAGTDPFAADARARALAPRTLKLRRAQIHAAVTALIESGVAASAISSLAHLVLPDNFKRILRRRLEVGGGGENAFNRDLAEALVQIAREWVKVEAVALAELKRLAGKVPMPTSGLTDKNKSSLRQFDDPATMQRLIDLPKRLWAEVKAGKPNFRTLAKAQAALAIAVLPFMPLRPQNLAALTFDVHLFLRAEARATSTLELSAGEVKNKEPLAFDIPPYVAKMLFEDRDRIAP